MCGRGGDVREGVRCVGRVEGCGGRGGGVECGWRGGACVVRSEVCGWEWVDVDGGRVRCGWDK